MNPPEHEHFEHLLMKQIDGFATPAEQTELQRHVQTCAACSADLQAFGADKAATDGLRERIADDVEQDPLRPTVATRWVDRLGFGIAVVAAAVLAGGAVWQFWNDPAVSPLIRGSVAALVAAGAAVFANVLRLRSASAPTDPYRHIDR